MTPTISRKLNIVLNPFETKDGLAYVHSIPVGRQTFEMCFRPMARAMSAIVSEGIGPITGPSIAALLLQQEANIIGEGDAISKTLMPEIKRLTNVMIAGKDQVIPYGVVEQRNILDEDQRSEIENLLVFFTLASWIRLPEGLSRGLGIEGLRELWKAQTTSLELMGFMSSLKTSTTPASSGEKTLTPPSATNPSSIAA
jgi:hypothetical protein